MTEEEINKKAEKHCNEVLCNAHEKCYEFLKCRDWRSRRAGFFCGYEQALKDFEKENAELKNEVRELKLLVSSLVYEINQIWDINEMNDDLRMCAEKIDREVQLSKMAEDNRMVISALGFAAVPPKPKLDVKEV